MSMASIHYLTPHGSTLSTPPRTNRNLNKPKGNANTLHHRTAPRSVFLQKHLSLNSRNNKWRSKFLMSSISESVTEAETEPRGLEYASSQSFDWKTNWYAVQFVEHMDPTKPQAVTILGRNMVLWRDSNQKWRCFLDECPHRLVPLSEGRIDETGELQCSYHGWRFSGEGNCLSIPQAKAEGSESKAMNSLRACAKAFPTTLSQGLLFVWPDEFGWEASSLKPPPLVSNIDETKYKAYGVVRDLDYGYEMLGENVTDASHLPFAHHGVGRFNRTFGKPLAFKITKQNGVFGFEGFSEDDVLPSKGLRVEFKAPSLFIADRHIAIRTKKNQTEPAKEVHLITNLYITPVSPSKSRIIVHTLSSGLPSPPFLPKPPPFLLHFSGMNVLDGDAFMLHAQEKALLKRKRKGERGEGDGWKTDYYMPTTADVYTSAFRSWLSKYSGGTVAWPEGTDRYVPPNREPKTLVLDRYEGHTKNCASCLTALERFKTARVASAYSVVVFLLASVLVRAPVWVRLGLGLASLGSVAFFFWLEKFIQQFYYVGYDHTEK